MFLTAAMLHPWVAFTLLMLIMSMLSINYDDNSGKDNDDNNGISGSVL